MIFGLTILFALSIIIGYGYIKSLNSYEGYITQQLGEDRIRVVSATSVEDALKKSEQNAETGIIFLDIEEKKMAKLKIGQRIKGYYGDNVNASAPISVKAFFIIYAND